MKTVHLLLVILIASTLIGCGYNDIQRQDESVKAAWSEVINQYQRRADLVPNLVNTLKGYIQHEERVFVEVTNARAKVGSIQVNTDSLKDPQTLQTFQSVQGELSTALSRLMIVSERYPDLKADGLFQNLQAQLEGTENRITVARNRYVQTIQQYNSLIRVFPNNLTAMMFDYEVKPNFKVENENAISTAPTIEFGSN
ncbi:LemA family protein [Vibrio anguillarum]|uniref:LemA family protein n=8 Tax=Vibrio anguillarum TaxID=55601 RepID=UPI00188A9280|nr:LemA family protein [Vibrio anguillarum]MBF4256824.1 LemA family protein [Vibrio anguillarum]MBF4278207.1 LemA family protein [Vibrio anguillarum]MBF4298808.1 LemA family protein [Vibrio anguillarum]MBF4334920.1 LemA family protein [Vibrio anguillarum]MBF4362646.1 LemA family protein [Vibrio anguillarum]